MGKKAKSKYPRRRKKHRGVRAFFTVLTFCVIVGAIIMSLTVFLKVAKVEVRGAARYKSSDIVLASGIKVGDNLFGINKFAVSDKVLKKYPYIETLKITRRLPDTFVFTVTERVPCGYIDLGEQRWIIDKTGTLLERTSVKKKINLPKILAGEPLLAPVVGDKINWKEAGRLPALELVLREVQAAGLVSKIGQVDASALYSISFTYENRFRVVLGGSENMAKKFKMLAAVIPKLAPTDRGTLNVSDVKKVRFTPNAAIKF